MCCPFHADGTPSLHIYSAQNRFHCFGCGAGGSVIDFEALRTGDSSVSNALRSLAARYPEVARLVQMAPKRAPGVTDEEPEREEKVPRKQWRATVTRTAIAREVQRAISGMYEKALWHEDAQHARRYVMEVRGLSEETLRAFGCGYAPGGGDWAVRMLEEAGLPQEHAIIGGVARQGKEKADIVYDIFRDRVVTPIRNVKGETVALAGRLLGESERSSRQPKYINGPETEIFRKRDALFGIDLAKDAAGAKVEFEDEELGTGKLGFVLVVEGYMDVMTIYEHTEGNVACVATMGTSVSTKQLEAAHDLLEDPVDGKLIINFDGDDAGIAAAERLCDSVIPESTCAHAVQIAVLPPDLKDPDEFLCIHGSGDDYISYLMDVALPWYDWRGRRIIIEELMIAEAEEGDGNKVAQIEREEQEEIEPAERAMINLDPSDQSFDFQVAEYLKQQGDEMIVAFGGPPELISKKPKQKSRFSASKEVVEALAKILESAQRSIPGLNSGAVVHSWADSLSRSNALAITPLYRKILKRAEELSKPWLQLSHIVQVKWMPPPPWIVEELPRKKRRHIQQSSGLTMGGRDMDLKTYMADKKRIEKSAKRLQAQEAHVIPHFERRRSEQLKMLKVAPRRAAEEIVLRCLIFASEHDRLDGLEKLLEVMVWCQERELPFWTSKVRESLFDYLTDVEGPVTPAEMAAYLEETEWWGAEIEQLFFPIEDEADIEWQTLRSLEVANPVAVVESTGRSVAEMAGKVASRLALVETGELAEKMLEKSRKKEYDEFERLLAKQISLKKAVNKTKYLNPEEVQITKEQEVERKQKLEYEQLVRLTLEQLKTVSVPYPEHFEGREETPSPSVPSGNSESDSQDGSI